jgi:hypothetical protein
MSTTAIVVEFILEGTQLGPLGPLPPTGRPFSCQMAAFFLFEGETLVCERIYSDTLSIVRQLLGDLTAMEALGALGRRRQGSGRVGVGPEKRRAREKDRASP